MARRRLVTSRYREDHKSFGRFMLSERMRGVAAQAAGDIADVARATAPKDTGAYASAFRVNKLVPPLSVKGNLRAIAHVYNNDPAAAPLEFGTRKGRPARRILRRAGDRFHTPKRGAGG